MKGTKNMKCSDLGPPDAKVVLVTDCPNEQEERSGILYSSQCNKMLKSMMMHAGLKFADCYATAVMLVRPPNGDFSYMYDGNVPKTQLSEHWESLRNKITAIKPDVVITFGKEPLRALCNKFSVDDYRGTWLSFRNINVLPTFHPSYVMKMYEEHAVLEMDIAKAIKQKPAADPYIILNPTLQMIADWIYKARKSGNIVSYDIETVSDCIRCVGFATKNPQLNAIVIPFMKFPSSSMIKGTIVSVGQDGSMSSYWNTNDEVLVLDMLSNFLTDRFVRFVGQNSVSFDAPFIRRHFDISVANQYMDTMDAWHVLYSEFNKGLDFLCSVLTDYKNYWADKDTSDDISEWTYNGMDCIVTYECAIKIEKELAETAVSV